MLHSIIQIYVNAFLPLCLLTLGAAIRWGGTTERVIAWSCVLASAMQKVLMALLGHNFSHLEPTVMIVDLALLIAFCWMSLRDPRWWVLTACAFQLLSASAHLGHLVDTGMSPLAYAILNGTGGYPTQLALIAGIVGYHTRTRRRSAG
jgi:presenilin-like A22 family membrane protease